jgi:zinc protease
VGDGGITRGLEGLLTEAERVRRHGFTATELARARDELRRAYERAHAERDKTPSAAYAGEYTRHFLEGEPIPGIEVEYRLVQALLPGITLAEVDSAARAWLERSDRVLLADAPDKPGLTPPDEADLRAVLGRVSAARVAAYEDAVDDEPLVPDPPAPGRVVAETQDARLGTVAWTLSNGARVIVRPTDFKADEVLMSGFSPGGHSLAPDSLFLNAWLAADLARLGGVGAFDAVALQKKLAGRLVRVGSYVGITQEGVSASGSPQDLETMLQLTWLGFTAPRADTAAFQAFLANARAAMANRGAIPEQAFSDTVQVTLAEHHPRVRPVTPAILDSLDLGRALAFYRDRFADASDFTFVFVGAVDPDSLRPLAARWLGSLPALRRGERWRDPGIRPPRGVVERTVRKGVEPKAYTQIVFAGDWQDARANRAAIRGLARALEIQLRDELREALGATYSVGVSASTFREPHPSYSLSIQFGSAPERVDALAREVFAIVDAMRAGGPRPADLAKVVEAEVRARETALRQNGYWLNGLVFLAQTGEDPAGLLDPRGDADLMTAGAIRAAARRYLDPARHVRVTLLPEEGAVP